MGKKKNPLEGLLEVGSYLLPVEGAIGSAFGIGGKSAEDLSKEQQERYQELHDQYMAQIEPNRMARMEALGKTMSLFQPAADVLKSQYGTDIDYSSMFGTDPLTSAEAEISMRNARTAKPEDKPEEEVPWPGIFKNMTKALAPVGSLEEEWSPREGSKPQKARKR